MYKQLRKKLTIYYSCMIGVILLVATIILGGYFYRITMNKEKASFISNANEIEESIHNATSKITEGDRAIDFLDVKWNRNTMEADNMVCVLQQGSAKNTYYYFGNHKDTEQQELMQEVFSYLSSGKGLYIESRFATKKDSELQNAKQFLVAGSAVTGTYKSHSGITYRYYYHTAFVKNIKVASPVYVPTRETASGHYGKLISSVQQGINLIVLKPVQTKEQIQYKISIAMTIIYILLMIVIYCITYVFMGNVLHPIYQNDQKQKEFIASASHELKTPIAVILANVSALEVSGEENQHFKAVIRRECQRMGDLVNNLLLLSASETGRLTIQKEVINPEEIALEVYEKYVELAKIHGHEMNFLISEEIIPQILGDRERLEQVLSIFVDNAISYSGDQAAIDLKVNNRIEDIQFLVIDHGIGITGEQKQHIFERFYQGSQSHKNKHHYGLGLNIAMELVKLHGGSISVQDTPGGGVTMVVTIKAEIVE